MCRSPDHTPSVVVGPGIGFKKHKAEKVHQVANGGGRAGFSACGGARGASCRSQASLTGRGAGVRLEALGISEAG